MGKKGENGEKKFWFQGNEWDSNCMSAMSAFIKGEIIAHNWKKKLKQIVLEQFLEGKLFIMFIGKWLNYDQYSG